MSSRSSSEGEWKAATDSKSGRVYYYHTKTKATTWTKPLELAGPEERKLMIEMKEKTLKFFREMEQNIRDNIIRARLIDEENYKNRSNSGTEDDDGYYCLDERGSFIHDNSNNRTQIPGFDAVTKFRLSSFSRGTSGSGDLGSARDSPHTHRDSIDYGSFDPKLANRARKNSSSGLGMGPPRRIRTISTMDDEILLTMRRNAGGVSAVEGGPGVGDRRSAYYNVPVGSNSIGIANSTAARSRDPFLDAKADEKDKFGGPSNLMRDTSKEIGDRVDHLYPTRPAAVNPQYLVDHMNTSVNAPGKRPLHGANHDCNKCTRLRRRNSTGTIFLSHTMSNQDNAATIECVCVVIRAHMLDAAKENVVPLPEYDIFKDASYQTPARAGRGRSGSIAASVPPTADSKPSGSAEANVPSLSTVKDFFMYVFSKSQLESDTIIMALIYCERLVKETKGKLCIRYDNWRSILFACLVMASKVWDDLSMWNVDFSQVYPSFDLRRVNTLELAMLDALKYVIRVSASEYAKYYFHLRSMMARLGLNNTTGEPQLLKPLDIIGARKLQLSTQQYLEQHGASAETTRRRFYSVHETGSNTNIDGTQSTSSNKQPKNTVGLEQLVRADHMDADGQKHIGKNASFKSTEKKNKSAKKLSTVTEVK